MKYAAIPLLLFALVLAACGPPPPMTAARAERLCRDEARQADGFSGRVGAGVSSDGPVARGSITITNDIFNPRSEQEALNACVIRRLEGRPDPVRYGITLGGET